MKILIIKPSSLGDVIHALPFLKAVKDSFPTARADWIISKPLKGLLEDNPLIHELIIFNKDDWKNFHDLPATLSDLCAFKKNLRSRRYDMVVDLQGLLRSGLIAFSTKTPLKVGFADAREGSRHFYDKKVSAPPSLHAVDRCLEVAKGIGATVKDADFPLSISKTAHANVQKLLGNTKEYIVIVPSARWPTKRWPVEQFSALIKKIPLPCVLSGSKGDRKIARKIIEDNTQVKAISSRNITIDLCGKTDLKELMALIAGAKAVVSNDSGPMHIAAALDTPVIAIFGPTDPVRTGPYGWQRSKKAKVLRADVPCSPCRKRKCNAFICMSSVSVQSVYAALKEFL